MTQPEMPVKQRWILRLAVVLMLLAIFNYIAWGLRPGPLYLLYANATLPGLLWLGGSFLMIPVATIVIGWVAIRDFLHTRVMRTSKLTGLAVAIFACVTMFISFLAIRANLYWHRDGVVFSDHVYYLASHNIYPDFGFGQYEVFECDSLGITCQPVFQTEWGVDTVPQAGMYVEAGELVIVVDGWPEERRFFYTP